jgi:hypothetical protein
MFVSARKLFLLIVPLILGTVLLSTLVVLVVRPVNIVQGAVKRPIVQMLSSTFPDQNLPLVGSTVTLISISFTTTYTAQVEATSLIDALWGGGGCCGQGGPTVTETTMMAIDGVQIGSSSWSSNSTLPAQLSITRTQTGLTPGSHVLTVTCNGSSSVPGQGMQVLARSGGTSVIIVSGA